MDLKKLLLAGTAALVFPAVAGATTVVETDTETTTVLETELSETLNLDGFSGAPAGTVLTSVKITLTARIDESSTLSLTNNSGTTQLVEGSSNSSFLFSSAVTIPDNPAQVQAPTGPQNIAAGATETFNVSGEQTNMLEFFGADVNQFINPFTIDVATLSGVSITGGGGQISSDQTTFGEAIVTVEYHVDEIGTVPLPASALLLLTALGGVGFLGMRRKA